MRRVLGKLERRALGFILWATTCGACATRPIQYDGMPPAAVGFTYCDNRGTIRSLLDADLFRLMLDGSTIGLTTVPEILAHEAVHREQLEQRRSGPGKCPPPYSWMELVDIEIAGYCAGFKVAAQLGYHPGEVGRRYGRAFHRQFDGAFAIPAAVEHHVTPRWNAACPGKPLIWADP